MNRGPSQELEVGLCTGHTFRMFSILIRHIHATDFSRSLYLCCMCCTGVFRAMFDKRSLIPTWEYLGLEALPPVILLFCLQAHSQHLEVIRGWLRTCIDKIIICNDIGWFYWRSLGHQYARRLASIIIYVIWQIAYWGVSMAIDWLKSRLIPV